MRAPLSSGRSRSDVPPGRGTSWAVAASAAAAALVLLASPLPSAAAPSLNDAIVEVSESSYPILKALRAETFPPFSEKVGKLVLDIKPDKLGKAIGLGIDVFVSPPPEQLDAFRKTVKDSLADLDPSSCTLVPLPSAALADKFKAVAAENVEAEKLKAFNEAYGPTLTALPKAKDNSAICLPPAKTLDALALAQADLARAFAKEPSDRFAAYTTPLLKQSVSIGKVLPLVGDAKKLTPSATPAELAAFQAAGKRVESAAKAEAQRVNLERLKEKKAAADAARQAGKPAAAPSATSTTSPEVEAARKAALEKQEKQAAEAQARKEAARQEAEARNEELKAKAAALREAAAKDAEAKKEAEAARVAELKARIAAQREAAAQKAAQGSK